MNGSNGNISVEDLRQSLASVPLDEKGLDYLNYVKRQLELGDYENKNELIQVVEEKIKEREQQVTDEEALDMLQTRNEEFNNLNIITTDKYSNDSGLDLTYLTYKTTDGKVRMLEYTNQNKIIDYIKSHEGQNYTSEDVFRYFSENVYREVNFENPEIAKEDASMPKARKVDEETLAIEKDKINEYVKENNLHDEVNVGVDYNGERFYQIGETVITFANVEGRRELKVLNKPSQELEQTNEKNNDGTEIVTEESELESYGGTGAVNIDLDTFTELMTRRYNFDEELNGMEMQQLISYADELISTMQQRIDNNDLQSVEQFALTTYIDHIKSSYDAILEGVTPEYELNEAQMAQVAEYYRLEEMINRLVESGELNLSNGKNLTLKQEQKSSGIANVLIILELCLLAAVTLTFVIK